MRIFWSVFVLLACLSATLGKAHADTWLIHDVRVFDGQRVTEPRHVLLGEGRILDADFKGVAPDKAQRIDGHGMTLLPGLIDAHVHAYAELALPLRFGVTTQLDMFLAVPSMQAVNQAMREGRNSHQTDLFSAGLLATAPGGHGTEYYLKPPTLTQAQQAEAFVASRLAEGSWFIKIVVDSGTPEHRFNSLDETIVRALVRAAHARGKLAVAHVRVLSDARMAVRAGVDGLAHWVRDEDVDAADMEQFVAALKAQQVFVIPTVSVLESVAGLTSQELLGDQRISSKLTPAQAASLNRSIGKTAHPEAMRATMASLTGLIRAGIPVLAGTDSGNSGTLFGASLHHELLMLVQSGMTPLQALRAATFLPATTFGLADRGQIAPGLKADLLLVRGRPDERITDTRNIEMVWKDGVLVFPAPSMGATGLSSVQP